MGPSKSINGGPSPCPVSPSPSPLCILRGLTGSVDTRQLCPRPLPPTPYTLPSCLWSPLGPTCKVAHTCSMVSPLGTRPGDKVPMRGSRLKMFGRGVPGFSEPRVGTGWEDFFSRWVHHLGHGLHTPQHGPSVSGPKAGPVGTAMRQGCR